MAPTDEARHVEARPPAVVVTATPATPGRQPEGLLQRAVHDDDPVKFGASTRPSSDSGRTGLENCYRDVELSRHDRRAVPAAFRGNGEITARFSSGHPIAPGRDQGGPSAELGHGFMDENFATDHRTRATTAPPCRR